MNCPNCANPLEPNSKFCSKCGFNLENQTTATTVQTISSVEQNVVNQEFVNAIPVSKKKEKSYDTLGMISMIVGIIAFLLALFLNVLIIPVAIIGLIMGIISKKKGGIKTTGIIFNILAIVGSIVIIVVSILFALTFVKDKEHSNSGYIVRLNYKWTENNEGNDNVTFKYFESDATLSPNNDAKLDSLVSCDFSLDSCKDTMYDALYYTLLSKTIPNGMTLEKINPKYQLLKDDIYYMMINVKKSSNIVGRYYIVASKSYNYVVTFMLNVNDADIDSIHEEVMIIINSIEFKDNLATNSTTISNTKRVGSEKYGYVTIPTEWQIYSDASTGTSIQYSSNDSYILTMNAFDSSVYDAKGYATLTANNMQNEGVTKLTTAMVKVANYNAYQVYGYYTSDNTWLVVWYFKTEDEMVHYLAVEGPDNLSDNFKIPDTFSLSK